MAATRRLLGQTPDDLAILSTVRCDGLSYFHRPIQSTRALSQAPDTIRDKITFDTKRGMGILPNLGFGRKVDTFNKDKQNSMAGVSLPVRFE